MFVSASFGFIASVFIGIAIIVAIRLGYERCLDDINGKRDEFDAQGYKYDEALHFGERK